ncbi:hypothetical protein MTO96_036236 [Rhipicephalus appendiculatus]
MAAVSSCACLSCKVVFANAELHRSHYKSDWHRYNLKRKVAFLPPVSAEEFQQRVLAHREASVAAETRAAGTYCDVCSKRFGAPKAFENHVNSKKHQQALVMAQAGKPEESSAASSEVIARPKPERSESTSSCSSMVARKNAKNASEHAPLSQQKTPAQRMPVAALWQMWPTWGVRTPSSSPDAEYLVDVEGLLTYLGYKLGVGRLCLWCSNERSAPYVSVQAARQHMRDKGHCKMAHDGLVLPSGAVAGHRALARYYRQNLPAVAASRSGDSARHVLSQYRALGWTGATSRDVAQQKARDIRFIQSVRAKRHLKLGCKANKFQKHFRQQVMF